MRPLQSVAMGLVVVAITADFGGYDALPDPLGWVLVLLGLRSLPGDLERRAALRALAGLALLVSAALWWPGAADRLFDLHPSLAWLADLPRLGFAALIALVLARRAARAGDTAAAAWGRTATTGLVVAAVLPVLVLGAGVDALEVPAAAVAALSLVLLVWLLFAWSGRAWARGPEAADDQGAAGQVD